VSHLFSSKTIQFLVQKRTTFNYYRSKEVSHLYYLNHNNHNQLAPRPDSNDMSCLQTPVPQGVAMAERRVKTSCDHAARCFASSEYKWI